MSGLGEGLAERIQPMRGAAQKASASFAEQLTDSTGRSDADSPTPSNPFREPTHRAKSVKYRYTATGKHLSSPLKGSSSSPERKRDKPKKPRLTTLTPAAPSHAAKGKAPAVATTSRKRKASIVSPHRDELFNSAFSSSPSPLSSVPTSPIASTNDLPPSPTLTAKVPISVPPKRRPVSKTLSLHTAGTAASKFSLLSQPLSSKRKQKKTKTNASTRGDDSWDIGNSVWVLVNPSGAVVDNATQSQSELMWWPAQVVQKHPLRVSMFGDFPSSSSTNRGLCTIFAPSSSNVQSIHDDSGAKRFSCTTFCLPSLSISDDAGPPSKKPRLDDLASMEARWESAVQCMEKASTLEKDGLPALLSTYAATGGSIYDSLSDSDNDTSNLTQSLRKSKNSTSKKSKPTEPTRKLGPQRSMASLKDDKDYLVKTIEERSWSPCPPDPTLQIPGELVLALAPRTGGSYWPGQIIKHVPHMKEKYLVKFLDEEQHVITRDMFWTSEEEGFVQCTLGEWESAVKTTDDLESDDEGEEYGISEDLDDSALPPPPTAEDFEDLSVRAQLAYVKPVLRAILNKEYVPAKGRHEAFMLGGRARVELLKSAGVRGGMDARFVKAVQKVTCEWVLGGRGVRPESLDVGDIAPGSDEVGGASAKVASSDVAPADVPPRESAEDDKMEGIESMMVPEDVHADKKDGQASGALPANKQVAEVAVEVDEQNPIAPAPLTNGVTLPPAIKSQLDLLAEVSQAVATEPSLLPSHPELPRLKIPLLNIMRKDTSSQPSPLTPVPNEDQTSLPRRGLPVVCEEFEALTGVEKLDYCLNVLLPESIQQILLWRSGERTSSALLSPEEEQRLHDVGARKAAETDWVDDVMRLRAAQARLRGIDLNKKEEEKKSELQGGTRSRPRRVTVSRP